VLCGRRHLDNAHPLTCPECIASVRTDLDDIRWSCRHLRWQASRGGADGRLLAAAPIPGGDAMVLLARAGVERDDLWWSKTLDDDHRADDVVPPLLPLIAWEQIWRDHFDHPARTVDRAPVTAITRYLADQLTVIAQTTDGPDWPGFARDMGALRRELELVLHDEREPETGVSCFECGDRLVRRFGKPKPCRHVAQARAAGVTVTHWVYMLSTYPELEDDHAQCRDQGGITDPSVGQSWECPGCRKQYTAGEYATAVRRDLLEGGPGADGWTHVAMAAEAATTMTGYLFPSGTVRRWMDRGKVGALCQWTPGSRWGLRLVFWPDVADEAAAAIDRHLAAEAERAKRAEQKRQLRKALDAGESFDAAVERLGIHPKRAEAFVGEWAVEERRAAS
jgi:hypothetical protein